MEKQIWQTIRSKLNDFFIQRIETSIERGIPDVHYCVQGVSGWLEGKYLKSPKRENTKLKLKLSIEQIAWHKSYSYLGGLVYLIVKKDKKIYLFDSDDGEALAKGVTREDWEKKALAKDWDKIRIILSSPKKKILDQMKYWNQWKGKYEK
tara:strand:+ start:37 stop:486 length:450 start_codon:yes stop_codon:yes gene_type:complete